MQKGYFGKYGGSFVPPVLEVLLNELNDEFEKAILDPIFLEELHVLSKQVTGRPNPLYEAHRLSEYSGGAQILFKREDLNHMGAHKINNTLGQVLLAKRMGKKRVIAETGAGQHGVATATACALFDMECIIYMGEIDVKRQALNVFRMEMLGAKVISATSGQRNLKSAVDEALLDFIENASTTFYLLGSAVGPHPYPTMVKYFHRIIGIEAREQHLTRFGRLPDALLACVGGGSNAIGLFDAFMKDESVIKYGVVPAGYGLHTNLHAANITKGVEGIIHGFKTLILKDEHDEPSLVHSIAAGLNYPGVGPEHSYFHDAGLVKYVSVTDEETLKAFFLTSRLEGIIPALETAHAIAYAIKLARTMPKDATLIVNLSGRGDKDVEQLKEMIDKEDPRIAFYIEKDFEF